MILNSWHKMISGKANGDKDPDVGVGICSGSNHHYDTVVIHIYMGQIDRESG